MFSYCPQPISTYSLYMTLKHISNYKSLLWLKQCKSFQLHYIFQVSKWPLYYHLTLRGHNFAFSLCTVMSTCVKLKLLGCIFCWYQCWLDSEWPNWHCFPFVRAHGMRPFYWGISVYVQFTARLRRLNYIHWVWQHLLTFCFICDTYAPSGCRGVHSSCLLVHSVWGWCQPVSWKWSN